ncbi:MAG: 3-deoxy-7-phosphoheptulonate synthase [Clostridia bacterium]|nr:3-deoxy-7-phosphoheptulonate synthase [Clostridia bacterium]
MIDFESFKREFNIIAGPCAIENKKQIETIAAAVKDSGATVLRGGAFKLRSDANSFMGLGPDGAKLLVNAGKKVGLPVLTEVTKISDLQFLSDVDILQIGTRNMQNYPLITETAKTGKIILLKRGFGCTIKEYLQSVEYIKKEGNDKIILCERGIRTFETALRNTFDVSAVAILKDKTNFPVFADPSHASGDRKYVKRLSLSAVAIGCDGLEIEVHNAPEKALSDREQALNLDEFKELVSQVKELRKTVQNFYE